MPSTEIWEFFAFESRWEGTPIHDWYGKLPKWHRLEVTSVLVALRKMPRRAWTRPLFDPLDGEGGISEVIIPDIRDDNGVAYYRIYGYFGPAKLNYTFLHAVDKKEKNDREGKDIAKFRLHQLEFDDQRQYRIGKFVI